MIESRWYKQSCGVGRDYFLGKDIYVKYTEREAIIKRIKENIREYVLVETAVRFTTDGQYTDSERLVISIPHHNPNDIILDSLAEMLYHSMLGYYIRGDNKTKHFGMSNLTLEGYDNSLLRRELELLFKNFTQRADITGRLVNNIQLIAEKESGVGDCYMQEILNEGIDIHVGFRLLLYGSTIHNNNVFIPIVTGNSVIEQIYYNMEQLIHGYFSTYDDLGEKGYLKVTNTLIFKELVEILKKARNKTNIRKKILNNVNFTTLLTDDVVKLYGELAGDVVYDTINELDNEQIKAAGNRSRELYSSFMIRSAEITDSSVDYKSVVGLQEVDQQVFVPSRPAASTTTKKTTSPSPVQQKTQGVRNSFEVDDSAIEEL